MRKAHFLIFDMFDFINTLEDYLLKQVTFCLEEKTVRRGKLLLLNSDGYYIRFTIQTNKNMNKIYEVPLPYNIIKSNNSVKFSYTIDSLCKGNEPKMDFMNSVTPVTGVHKLHNKCLTISVIEH